MLGFDVTYDFESFFADQEEIVDNSSNRLRVYRKSSINPPSLWLIYFKQVLGGLIETGRVLEREGLFNLVKMVLSALHKELEYKVEKLNRGS